MERYPLVRAKLANFAAPGGQKYASLLPPQWGGDVVAPILDNVVFLNSHLGLDNAMYRIIAILTLCCSNPIAAADWPSFRGPRGDGISEETKAPLEWGPTKNLKWMAALPRPGNGSPIVSGGKVFV